MSAVRAPADRRFRRAHVKPARKPHVFLARLRSVAQFALVLLVLAIGAYESTNLAAHARVLQVDRIVVGGNERLSNGEVMAVLDGLRGENLLRTDLDAWRRRLMASPWVRDALLRRKLPATVEVVISERQPVGIGRLKGEMYLVDDSGVVIDQYGPQYADLDLPIIDGLSGRDGSTVEYERAELAARVITAVKPKPEIARRLSQVDVADAHNAAVILSGDPAVLYIGEDRFLPRLQSYAELAAALRERVPAIDYADLRFDDRIYVRPAGKPAGSRDNPVKPAARKNRRR